MKGASKWIDEIFAEGYVLMSIYYRANGVVNINYTDYDMNYNATLQIDDGTAQLVRANDYGPASTLSESSYGGVYEASVLARVTFPDRFPYEAETQPPTPSEGYTRDLDGDGQEETVSVYEKIGTNEYGDPARSVMIAVWGPGGAFCGEEQLRDLQGLDGAQYRVTAYQLGNGMLYVEARLYWDNVATDYMLFQLDENGLTRVCHIADPGYTDAAGLRNELTGSDLFYSDDLGDADAKHMIPALNGAFEAYGIRFVEADGGFEVDLPSDRLIFDLRDTDIPKP